MKWNTLFTLLAGFLLAPALQAQDVLITPSTITSSTSGTDVSPAVNLINGNGLSGTPTLAALGTHAASGNINAWVTDGTYPGDYFAGFPEPPVLTCTLPGGAKSLSGLVIWGFDGNPSEAKSFTVSFSTDGSIYGNDATVFQLTLLGTGAALLPFPGGPRLATHVKVTVTDNHYVAPGTAGGDRVVLGELRFAGQNVPIVVTTNADSGTGSLRAALATAAAQAGPDVITFDPGLSGGTISLSSEIVLGSDVTLDASSLPAGLTINDGSGQSYRLFTVSSGTTVTLRGLTLANGGGALFGNFGGAITNSGTLTLTQCSLSGNTGTDGGNGGAIFNGRTAILTLTQCTLSGNSARFGGAIFNGGTLTLTHCTLSGNSADLGDGGAIYNDGPLTLNNSIVAGNSDSAGGFGPDIFNAAATITPTGVNLIGDLASSTLTTGTTVLVGAPQLAPLGNYGGPTQTMALLPGSPAIDAATVIGGLSTDQRGLSRNRDGNANSGAQPDIGAYEAQLAPVGSLGFNFNGASPRALAATDSAGAPGFAQTHWNNLTGDYDNGQTGPLSRTLSGGGTATVRTWYDSLNLWQYGATTTPDQKLMSGYLDSNGAANTGTDLYGTPQNQPFFALADLPAALTLGGYRVVVYADTDAAEGSTGEYWLTTHSGNPANVTGTSDLSPHLFLKDNANFTGTYTRVPATSTTRAGASAGNFLVFENQTQPAFILRTEDNPSPRAVINAVQIVRNELLVVTTTDDENDPNGTLGTGISLREAIALAPDGAGIVFDSALNGATITLGSEIVIEKSVVVDASSLPAGVMISGNDAHRIFTLGSGRTVALVGLALTGGNGVGNSSGRGGAIFNLGGKLTLTRCTLSDNSSDGDGGAIFNSGGSTLTLTSCTLSGNSTSYYGGAIYNDGGSTLTRCTLSANSTDGDGGAIYNSGPLTLTHCTLFGNMVTNGPGGAIYHYSGTLSLTHCTLSGNSATVGGSGIHADGTSLTLTNCIVAGSSGSGTDIYNDGGTVTRIGANIVQSLLHFAGGAVNGTGTISTTPPLLAPLSNYGGPTQTMALRPGSPARNAAVDSLATSDQRGFPIVGAPDIGAYEVGTFNTYMAWIWESLPTVGNGLITDPLHATTFDYDGDGVSNTNEWAALTDPASPASVFRISSALKSGANVILTFPSVTGRTYTLWQSDTLIGTWTDSGQTAVSGNGSPKTFTVPAPVNGVPKRFYRVQVSG